MQQPIKSAEDIDPELLDVIIQSISILSNVATLAATWRVFRQGTPPDQPRPEQNTDNLRIQLRQVRRNLEDAFEAVESALRILSTGTPMDNSSPSIIERRPRFGHGVVLPEAEMQRLSNHLSQLEHAALSARNALRGIQLILQHSNLPNVEHIRFDVEQFNEDLNVALFDSISFEDAMMKLRSLQRRAEDYITDLTVALRVN